MKLKINGEIREVSEARTVQDLLSALGYEGRTVAVALNGNFVARTAFAETTVSEDDELEIVSPIAGG